MRRDPTFRESDLRRALKVFVELGLPIGGAHISRSGDIEVVTEARQRVHLGAPSEDEDALSAWERDRGHRHA